MAEARQRPAIWQPEVALGALQGLDVRLLIDAQHQRILGRVEVEANDVSGLSRELGVGADAEGVSPLEVNPMTSQHAPYLMNRDVTQRL